MGMPNLPPDISTNINIDRKGLVKLLLMSIALEEVSLSHILNVEGEMMQLYIKKLKNNPYFRCQDLIKFNRNISDTLRIILEKEKTLKDKLYQVIQYEDDFDCDFDNDDCHCPNCEKCN